MFRVGSAVWVMFGTSCRIIWWWVLWLNRTGTIVEDCKDGLLKYAAFIRLPSVTIRFSFRMRMVRVSTDITQRGRC